MAWVESGGVKRSVKLNLVKDANNSTSRTFSGINVVGSNEQGQTVWTPDIDTVFNGFNLLFASVGILSGTIGKRTLVEDNEIVASD